jgi:Uma2 family endonuclease
MYSYPDLVVVCGEPEFLDAAEDVLLNPKVVFEVLSPSTEAFDRGGKFARYQTYNPTLTDYVLVAQDEPQIEHYRLQDDGSWAYRRHAGLKAKVVIESIRVTLKLADVYDRVKPSRK